MNTWEAVPVGGRAGEIEDRRGVIGEDEGEYRVLHEIVEGSSCQLIQLHQISEVGSLQEKI